MNDTKLLQAAREVFAEQGWDAPVAAIAQRAGLGIGSLYRRFPSKESLAQQMRISSTDELTEIARTALAEEPDAWSAVCRFVRDALQADAGALLPLVGRRSPSTPEIEAATARMRAAFDALIDAGHASGVLRQDVVSADIPLLLNHLNTRLPIDQPRLNQLHHRYAELALAGLRAEPLPPTLGDTPPDWDEIRRIWDGP